MSENSKRELLRDKVVDLVKEFIKNEGGITVSDLAALFGPVDEVANVLGSLPITYDIRLN
jgi:hypothetical protein